MGRHARFANTIPLAMPARVLNKWQILSRATIRKISASGIGSLTKSEKQRLNDLSKRLRGG